MRGGARAGRGRRDALRASAAPRPARASALAAAAAVAAVILALVPVGVGISPAAPSYVHKSEALAAEGGGSSGFYDATGFIDEVSQAADLTQNQFVSTVVGIVAGGTGLNLADGDIAPDISLSQNLDALAAAANYPDFDTLSADEQSGWGSKENYDAAKFNDLLIAFGQDGALQRYKASGGGDFDFTTDEAAILEDISTIGKTWLNRGSVAAERLYSLVGRSDVKAAYGPVYERITIPGDVDLWPDQWPRDIRVYDGNAAYYYQANRTYYITADRDVRIINVSDGSGFNRVLFDSEDFYRNGSNTGGYIVPTFDSSTSTGNYGTATPYEIDGETKVYYFTRGANHSSSIVNIIPAPFIVPSGTLTIGNLRNAAAAILGVQGHKNYIVVVNYPADSPSGETPIYYPGQDNGEPGSQNRDTPWQQFVTEPSGGPYVPPTPEERPENPFNPSNPDNPGYQSGTPEWKQETTENLQPALNIRFDKLFPFCLIYDIEMFWNKLKSVMIGDPSLAAQAVENYEVLRIPGLETVEGMENGMEFDLQPLREILNLIKPYMFWLLLITMIMGVVEFWRRILTGA